MSDPNDQSSDEGDSEGEKEERGEEGGSREGREQVSHVIDSRKENYLECPRTSPLDCPGRTEPDELPLREHRPAVGEAGGGVPG